MYKKRGFTLVELLVVMAIISILAAIAIPNVQKWIKKAKATRAASEINSMELAITKLLSDAERSSLTELLNMEQFFIAVDTAYTLRVGGALPAPPVGENRSMKQWDEDAFIVATELYTQLFYGLLRKGRGAPTSINGDDDFATVTYTTLFDLDVLKRLGTSYMNDLAFDPWGNLYQIYPGPWSVSQNGLIPFRTYLPSATTDKKLPGDDNTAVNGDLLTLITDSNGVELLDIATGEKVPRIGIPASPQMDVYIWSNGANLVSGQALFIHKVNGNYDPADGYANYNNLDQEPEFLGGGDDINNWDRETTYMQFYN